MGTLGTGIFQNDDAWIWLNDFRRAMSFDFIENTLDTVIGTGSDYLEAPEAQQGLAAADVVARLRGKYDPRGYDLPDVDRWIQTVQITPGEHLARKAIAAVDRILSPRSELLDLWEEGGESEDSRKWRMVLADLKARLET
jgi:hypothetical protein